MQEKLEIEISNSFVVWRDSTAYASFPTLCKYDDDILISFRIAPAEPIAPKSNADALHQQHIHPRSFLAVSRLNKRFRVENKYFFPSDLYASDQDPNLFVTSSGRFLMSSFSWRSVVSPEKDAAIATVYEATSGLSAVFWGGFTSFSLDKGHTWSGRSYLPPIPGYPDVVAGIRPQKGGRIRGQTIEIEGKLILPVYNCPVPKSSNYSAYQYVSYDDGSVWEFAGSIADYDDEAGVSYCEPTLYKTSCNEILAFHRTFGAGGRLAISRSSNKGETWSSPQLSDIVGHPFNAISLGSGYALLCYGLRINSYSIRARVFRETDISLIGPEIIIRAKGRTRDIGYPSSVLIQRGKILVVYYWIDQHYTRYISGNILDVNIS